VYYDGRLLVMWSESNTQLFFRKRSKQVPPGGECLMLLALKRQLTVTPKEQQFVRSSFWWSVFRPYPSTLIFLVAIET